MYISYSNLFQSVSISATPLRPQVYNYCYLTVKKNFFFIYLLGFVDNNAYLSGRVLSQMINSWVAFSKDILSHNPMGSDVTVSSFITFET